MNETNGVYTQRNSDARLSKNVTCTVDNAVTMTMRYAVEIM